VTRTSARILLVEDERAQRDPLVQFLSSRGYTVDAVSSGEDALERMGRTTYDALITDLRLPAMDGLEVIRRAHELDEELPVLLTTAYASVESAVEALRLGARDYLLKPLFLDEVERKVGWLLAHRALEQENARLRRALGGQQPGGEIVADSESMQQVLDLVRRSATSRANILLTGETGTGKGLTAKAIHLAGPDADQPFLTINLAAIPQSLMESELFGHERGAFTGAKDRREGTLRAAGSGTVFLDEIGELEPSVQAKLLQALEEGEVKPVGRDTAVRFQARVLTATNRDIEAMVDDGSFRADLYYRLNVLRIQLPPLRERLQDVPPLVHLLLQRLAAAMGAPTPIVSAAAMRALCRYPWPGNVRELRNVLERSLILVDHGRIGLEQLPVDVAGKASADMDLQEAVSQFERSHIAMVLRLCGGNRERAAEELGISLATLYRRLEKLQLKGLDREQEDP
jgi:DNA-binding NtrC family response regulator